MLAGKLSESHSIGLIQALGVIGQASIDNCSISDDAPTEGEVPLPRIGESLTLNRGCVNHVGTYSEQACPGCEGPDFDNREFVSAESLRHWYLETFGSIPEQLFDCPDFELLECKECSLNHFSPLMEGDESFYDWIAENDHYAQDRWDFGQILDHLNKPQIIFDIGAGSGRFALAATGAGHKVYCIDKSPVARRHLASLGFETGESIAALMDQGLTPNVVTAIQVLEHTAQPRSFLKDILQCPAGTIVALAVPDRKRHRFAIDPFDYPPHHVTRWDESSMRSVLSDLGFSGITLIREPLGRLDRTYVRFRRLLRSMRLDETPLRTLLDHLVTRMGKSPDTSVPFEEWASHSLLALANTNSREADQ